MSDQQHSNDMRFWMGLFIGGLIGALVLFFLGTKEGKKTGKLIHDKGEDFLDDINDKLEDLKEKGKEIAREGEVLKEHVIDVLDDEKQELTKEVSKNLDDALSHIEAIQERGRETTASLRKRLFKNIPKKG